MLYLSIGRTKLLQKRVVEPQQGPYEPHSLFSNYKEQGAIRHGFGAVYEVLHSKMVSKLPLDRQASKSKPEANRCHGQSAASRLRGDLLKIEHNRHVVPPGSLNKDQTRVRMALTWCYDVIKWGEMGLKWA